MNIVILTPVRLLGDGLAACFSTRPDMNTLAVVNDLSALRDTLSKVETHVVLIDVTQGVDLFDVRATAAEWPDVALVALGLNRIVASLLIVAKAKVWASEGWRVVITDQDGKAYAPPEFDQLSAA